MTHGIAAIGECMLELSGQGNDIWRMGHAGDTFNTLWAIRALIHTDRVDYVSAFGDDPFSRQQIAFFADHQIGIASSPIIAGARPGLYAISLSGAERSFTYWRGEAAARRLAEDPGLLEKSLANRTLVYFSGITLAILGAIDRRHLLTAIAQARTHGCLVAFDPNYRPRLWPDQIDARTAIDEALDVTDIALPTFPDEAMLFGDETPAATVERIARSGVAEIVVKNGDQAATVSHYGALAEVPARPVAVPIDTTGAGDSFNGAYIAARLLGAPPAEAAARAHLVASAVVRVRGALAPFELIRAAFNG